MSTKEQYQPIENLIYRRSSVWQTRMGLDHFVIEHVFLDSFYGDDGEEDFKVTAVTEVRWNYLLAKIKWYLPSCARSDSTDLEKTLVHELCHVLLAPEQAMIDPRIEEEGVTHTTTDKNQLQARYYEVMELSTEMATRALWLAWETNGGQ